ncbi:hypothetical protein ATCC90586_007238 [Pythium insidiosum]|nr:hypothetical protein ATCC90586_007238 [Pythium insidiosum]
MGLNAFSVVDETVADDFRQRFESRRGAQIMKNPEDKYYPLLKRFSTRCLNPKPPNGLPPDRGVRHEIDLKTFSSIQYPSTKSKTLKKFSVLDLVDGYYQFLETLPSDTLDRLYEDTWVCQAVFQSLPPLAQQFVMRSGPSAADGGATGPTSPTAFGHQAQRKMPPEFFHALQRLTKRAANRDIDDIHLEHLEQVLECMSESWLFANRDKCIFGADEVLVLGCFVGTQGVRADPAKIKVIAEWPLPQLQKDLRRWLGLANYLHRFTANYAEMARPLSDLLKKASEWGWTPECDQKEHGRERVISFQSRQLKGAERNYPVHDKELLAMKFALVKFVFTY